MINKKVRFNLCLYTISIFFVIVTSACTTLTSRMVENSQNYHYKNNPKNELMKRPEWINKCPESEETPSGKIFHFIGAFSTTPETANCDNLDFVRNKAVEDARNQVSQYLRSEVKSISKDKVSEKNESKSISQNKKENLVLMQESTDEIYVESYIKSSSSFSGLIRKEEYWEKLEPSFNSKPKFFYNIYIHYTINENNIKKALTEIEKKENINEKEKILFSNIQNSSEYLIKLLDKTNFLSTENEFKNYYFELCELNSSLKGLTYYSSLDLSNEERRDYENLKEKITKALQEYDPTDIQKQTYLSQIRFLENEIEDKEKQIDSLEFEISKLSDDKDSVIKSLDEQILLLKQQIETTTATFNTYIANISNEIERLQQNGVHLISTNIFAVYPNKPYFNFISKDFSISNSPVTNRDYISYLTLSGQTNYTKAELGLDNPVFFISLYDCINYCNWLSRLYNLPEYYSIKDGTIIQKNNTGYRLPSKTEIEFALSNNFTFSDSLFNKNLWTNEILDNEFVTVCNILNSGKELSTQKISLSESNAMITFIIARSCDE